MKENGTANTLGDGGKSDDISQNTKYTLYGAIVVLLLFILWVNTAQIKLPFVEVERVASITSWYSGAASTGTAHFFGSQKYPDIEIRILSVGTQNEEQYSPNDTLTEGSVGAIRIEITNTGRSRSGSWHIEANFPTKVPFTYTSEPQIPLERKEARTYLLTFDKLKAGTAQTMTLSVVHVEAESSKENNVTTTQVDIF